MFIKQSDDLLLLNENTEKSKTKLYEKYKPVVMGFLIKKLQNNYDLVEELTSEILIKVFTKLDKYNNNLPFNCWVHSITRNHLIDFYKKNSSKKAKIEREFVSIDKTLCDNHYFNNGGDNERKNFEIEDKLAQNKIENYDFYNNIDNYLDTIEDKSGVNIFKLKAIEGNNFEQVSVKLNINKNEVIRKYNKIRISLKKYIVLSKT